MADIEFQGTGGIIEGDLEDANVIVNLDAAFYVSDSDTDYATGSYVETPMTGSHSISVWIKPNDGQPAAESRILGIKGDTWAQNHAMIALQTDGKIGYTYKSNNNTSGAYTNAAVFSDGALTGWTHVCVTANHATGGAGGLILYINGIAQTLQSGSTANGNTSSVTFADWDGDSATTFYLGTQNADSSVDYGGYIADAKVFTDVLSQPEVAQLASKINCDPDTFGIDNLFSWHKCNEGTSTSIVDHQDSGSDYDLTITNPLASSGNWKFDAFSVNVQDNGTTTDGNFTVTQGKVEGKALTSVDFSGDTQLISCTSNTFYNSKTAFSVSGWFNHDNTHDGHTLHTIVNARDGGNDGMAISLDSANDRIRFRIGDGSSDDLYTGNSTITNGQWHHFVATRDASNNTAIYIDGVSAATGSSSKTISISSGNFGIGGRPSATDADEFSGKIRDVGCWSYALSADQVASLYSGTYPQTPNHEYKLDEGHATAALNNASGAFEDSGTETDADGQGIGLVDASCVNGTLNLDDRFTIETTGSFSAPRGTLEFSGNLDINCTNVDITSAENQFIHNNGKFTAKDAVDAFLAPNGATFFDFNLETTSGHDIDLRENITILGTLDLTGSNDNFVVDAANAAGNITMTMGNDDNQAIIESDTADTLRFNPHATREILITGGSSLKPCRVTGQDWKWDNGAAGAAGIKLANMKFEVAVDTDTGTGNAVNIILTGDCEFAAVTVAAGDTLDVDGHRIHTTGNVDINGNLKMGAGMWHAGANFDTSNAAVTEEAGATFLLEGTNYIHNNDGSFVGDANTNILLQGTKTTYLNSSDANVSTYAGNLIAGSGTATLGGPDRSGYKSKANNLTVATGATLAATGAHEITCLGDFTTSGGLLGASCLELNGSSEYAATAVFNDDRSVNNSADYTIELWFRRTETSGNETLFDFAHWDSSGSAYTGQSRTSAYMDAAGIIYWDTRTGGGTLCSRPQSSAGFDDSKWHHAAFVHKGASGAHTGTYSTGAKEIWIDGKLEARVLGGDTTTDAGSSVAGNMGYDQNKTMAFQVGRQVVSSIGNFFTGQIDEIRIWSDARTQAEIRANMFTEVAATADHLRHQWSFNEGTGTTNAALDTATDAEGEAHVAAPITPSAAGAWAGAGAFDKGSSTLVMAKSGTQTFTYIAGEDINNLTINDGSTTQLLCTNDSGGALDIYGDLTVNEKLKPHSSSGNTNVSIKAAGKTITIGSDVKTTAVAELYRLLFYHSGSSNVPELTAKRIICDLSSTVVATGDLTITEELEVDSGTTFNANGNTISCAFLDVDGGTVDLRNSTYTGRTGGSFNRFDFLHGGTLLTGNTTVTGTASPLTMFYLPASGNYEIVGDVSNVRMRDSGDLTVIGSVTNFTLDDSTNNIRQWHHTLDTQQLLDADENGDDDLRLTKPALDNAHELMTG